MLLTVLDATGTSQTIIASSQEAVTDGSGTITATGVSQLLDDANADRSGWLLQNLSSNPMYVNDLGQDAAADSGSFMIAAGAFFPPAGYPVTTAAINVLGTINDKFTFRKW